MKLTFLGTGTSQGVPVIACPCEVCQSIDFHDKRLRSSVHIEANGTSLVIDTGPDFRQQMLRERIRRVDAVLFTHEHKDHTAGFDDIRSFNFVQQMDMPVYAARRVIDQLKMEFSYIFAEKKYPGVPQVDIRLLDGQPFTVGNVKITPIEVMHYKLPVFGFRIGDLTYITDANHIPDSEKEKIRGSKVLILNALQKEPHISHFTLKEAVALSRELGVGQAYFTHISHKLGTHRDVSAELPENVYLAYDGQQISF